MALDTEVRDAFKERVLSDWIATVSTPLVLLGDRLGLYKTMALAGPQTAAELAKKAGLAERYVKEWLSHQAAAGYIHYDPDADTFDLPPEHAAVLADEGQPSFMVGAFQMAAGYIKGMHLMEQAFRTGKGVDYALQHPDVSEGVARFFQPIYTGQLTTDWIPAVDGLEERLKEGIRVADVGCGHGVSCALLAQTYPASTFHGFDSHEASIDGARRRAKEAEVEDRVTLEVASAQDFPGTYDAVLFLDCLHDMGDPLGAAKQVRQALTPDGTWMIVEPRGADDLAGNLNPIGQAYLASSTVNCVPSALAQEGGASLGAVAGPKAIEAILREAGFTRFRIAKETPFNLVYEARP